MISEAYVCGRLAIDTWFGSSRRKTTLQFPGCRLTARRPAGRWSFVVNSNKSTTTEQLMRWGSHATNLASSCSITRVVYIVFYYQTHQFIYFHSVAITRNVTVAMLCNLRPPDAKPVIFPNLRQVLSRSTYQLLSYSVLLLIPYVMLWPWPLTLRPW